MALEGNLRDFSLEHIFQLIHTGSKTGSLHIIRESDRAEAFVYFRNGKIFGAVSDYNRVPIGERLISAGYISADDLARGLEVQKNDEKRRKLGQVLIAEGLITPETLKTVVRAQIQSTVFDLLPWTEGEFQFLPQLPPTEDIGLLVSAKKVLSEGNLRLNEWDRVRDQVPSVGAVFSINDNAPRQTDITLSPRHWKLLRFIDGKRSVTELAELTQGSEFETSALLYDLALAGLLELLHIRENVQPPGETAAAPPASETSAETPSAVSARDETEADIASVADESAAEVIEAPVAEDLPSSEPAIVDRPETDFHPELDIDGIDDMFSNELLSYRGEFMGELTALTDDININRYRPKKSSNWEKIRSRKPIDQNIVELLAKRFK